MEDRGTVLRVLSVLDEQHRAGRAWVLDRHQLLSPAQLRSAVDLELVELADRDERAGLSALPGGLVSWAVRLTACGRDVLAYSRRLPSPRREEPGPGQQLVELLPSQMDVVRAFLGLGRELETPPAPGLAEQVRLARRAAGGQRWQLHLTEEQMESVAYAFWLHALTASTAERNRFARTYRV
jgi:hypothetical protein